MFSFLTFPFESYFKVLAALRPGGLLQVWSCDFRWNSPQGSEHPSVCISLQKGGVGKASSAVWDAHQGFWGFEWGWISKGRRLDGLDDV